MESLSTHQSRINLTIEEIYIITSQRQETENLRQQQHDQSHSQILHRILSNQSELRNLLQARPVPSETTQLPVDAVRSQDVISIKALVPDDQKLRCPLSCKCTCHARHCFNSHKSISNIVGLLFVGYSGCPRLRDCTKGNCRARSSCGLRVDYLFPPWLLAAAISVTVANSIYGDVQISLTSRNIVPSLAEVFRLSTLDDIEGLQCLFEIKLASPNDSVLMGATPIRVSPPLHFNNPSSVVFFFDTICLN